MNEKEKLARELVEHGWEYEDSMRLDIEALREALAWFRQHALAELSKETATTKPQKSQQINLFTGEPEAVIPVAKCKRTRPTKRREHAGGISETTWENDKRVVSVDFDYDSISDRIDGAKSVSNINASAILDLTGDVLDWVAEPWCIDGRAVDTSTMRYYKLQIARLILRPAALHYMRPKKLAEALGTTKQMLNKLSGDFSARFGIRPWFAASAEARASYAAGHKKSDSDEEVICE